MTRTPLLTFVDWRTMRWGGRCASPPSDDEVMSYRRYIDENCGIPTVEW